MKKQKILIITIISSIVLALLSGVIYWIVSNQKKDSENETDITLEEKIAEFIGESDLYDESELEVVMIVGEEYITNKDVEYYDKLFSASDSSASKARLEKESKIIQGALKSGMIENIREVRKFYNTPDKNYEERSEYVRILSDEIELSALKGIDFEMVSIWFINTDFTYPGTVEEAKKIAYNKISPIYEKVKSGELTMEQAGGLIALDDSLESLDSNYAGNAYQVRENFNIDEVRQFNPVLCETLEILEVGEISDILIELDNVTVNDEYLTGQESIYFFVKVTKKDESGWYSFDDWFETNTSNFSRIDIN